jgi:hypothetical protein
MKEQTQEQIPFPAIAQELESMVALEQEARDQALENKDQEYQDRVKSLDLQHTERMKHIVAEIGWPIASKVGSEASHLAWLLVQHADHDIAFQKNMYALMQEQAEGEIEAADIAYLTDRIAVGEHRPQTYGTQWIDDENTYEPRPIEDIEHVDERRSTVGLESLADYETGLREVYKISEHIPRFTKVK